MNSYDRLFKRRTFGIKLGLDVEKDLLERLGNPEVGLGIIHVAGTNGKGSVCAMLESVLVEAGLSVGLYTSPHLVRFHERFRVNGECISDKALAERVEEIERVAAETEKACAHEPTFFECSTAIALSHFATSGVKIAILETGMGGRLDATNVVMPLVSVISRIGIEHTEHLGNSISEIAEEKAGIIKPGRPVVCGAMADDAREVIEQVSKDQGSHLMDAAAHVSVRVISTDWAGQRLDLETGAGGYGRIDLPLLGAHQVENLALAVSTLELLGAIVGVPIPTEIVASGIARTCWPGRCQVLDENPPLVLDGAHNPGGAAALAATFKQVAKGKPIGLVLGMCDDKDVKAFLKPWAGKIEAVWTVGLQNERGLSAGDLGAMVRNVVDDVRESDLKSALEEVRIWAREKDGLGCIAGSLFLVGEVLEVLDHGK